MKNYVTQKMRGIRRMVWFWSWLVVMLAMTEVSWGQGIPLYGISQSNETATIGEVEVTFHIVEDDDLENDWVYFTAHYKPGFQQGDSDGFLLNDRGVGTGIKLTEYNALTANGTNLKFESSYKFTSISNAETLSNILKSCARNENEISLSGNTVTISGLTYSYKEDALKFISGSPIIINCKLEAIIEESLKAEIAGGDITIVGEYKPENRCDYSRLGDWEVPITINSGSLKLQNMHTGGTLNEDRSFILNGGNTEITDCDLGWNIKQTGGHLSLNNCYLSFMDDNAIDMEGGFLLIDKGSYQSPIGYKFLNITGNAKVEIIDGYFSGDISDYMIYQQAGTVTINNGLFGNKIKVEGGTLNVKDMQCMASNSGIEATGGAKVSIEGGLYSSDAMIAANPNQMLAPGYSYFTRYQEIQPGLRLAEINAEEVELLQVKPTSSASTTMNNCIEAAKTANVGPEGTDVRVVTKQDGEWKVQADESLVNALLPGLQEAINSLNSIING